MKSIKHIITVASGKGGVGKSTVTVNLAMALLNLGAQIGILDADIYGPSQPMMLGTTKETLRHDAKILEPVIAYGIRSMSIGYLIDLNAPIIWRGPMATSALQQLLYSTNWGNLDYLLIDLPPGTGDIQLTLAQKIANQSGVVVTTPQDVALQDVGKAIAMFQKVKVPVLGVIENMSSYHCSACGHKEALFGSGGGAKIAQKYNLDLLASLPLDSRVCLEADQGRPFVGLFPDSPLGQAYQKIARKIKEKVTKKSGDMRFPRIRIVQDD